MRKRKFMKRLAAVGASAVLALSLAGCGASSSSSSGSSSASSGSAKTEASSASSESTGSKKGLPDQIRIGYWASPNSEIIVKQTKALEKKYPDVKVKWVEFTSGADILTAIQSNSIDLATIGTPPGTTGIANGYNFHVYYIEDIIGESEGLIVRKDSGIKSMKDLKGKKIATSFSTTSHFSLLQALQQNNIKKSDVSLIDMDASNIYASWERKDIDGAYIWESVKTKLLNNGGREIISSKQVADNGSPTAEFGIVRDGFYKQYPNVVKSYINLLDKATGTFNNEPERASKIISGALGLTDKETLKAMGEVTELSKADQKEYIGTTKNPGSFAGILKKTSDFLKEEGNLKTSPDKKVFQKAILTELYDK